jgi:LUC7 N_terminus
MILSRDERAMIQARALLDQLMGKDRNKLRSKKQANLADSGSNHLPKDLCPSFMYSFCPHDLFTNTRLDLGKCPFVHSEIIKEGAAVPSAFDSKFKKIFKKKLFQVQQIINRRVKNQQTALSKKQEDTKKHYEPELQSKFSQLEFELSAGNFTKVSLLQAEINRLQALIDNKQIVCTICGSIDKSLKRSPHINGKQHKGCLKIKEALSLLENDDSASDISFISD